MAELDGVTRKCWAHSLGECDKLSREHVVSQSIFAASCDCPTLVDGAHRVPSGHLSESSLTARVLCRRHNSALSPLDAEAGRLSEVLLASARGQEIGRPELNGSLVERWVLKTLINGLVAGWSDRRKWSPGPPIVRSVFGFESIPTGCGLYSVDGDRSDLPGPSIQVAPVWTRVSHGQDKQLVGGQVRVHGLRLFVATHDTVVQQIVGRPAQRPQVFENESVRFVYRPAFIAVGAKGSNKDGIILRW